MSARSLHEVRDAQNAQPVSEYLTENVDVPTGQRLRRQDLGSCSGGRVLIGGLARSTGVDLFFKHLQGNASKPRWGELDTDLRRFITTC